MKEPQSNSRRILGYKFLHKTYLLGENVFRLNKKNKKNKTKHIKILKPNLRILLFGLKLP